MQFQTQYNHKKTPPTKNRGGSLVEKTGYISLEKQIERLMLSGQNLERARHEMYQGTDLEQPLDPNLNPKMEILDALQARKENIERKKQFLRDKEAEFEELKKLEKAESEKKLNEKTPE